MIRIIFIFFVAVIFFSSCSTDLEINADYKNIPVVYSLLDKNDTVHYIKLNKAFIGNIPVSDMAQESDSLNYDQATVKLFKYRNESKIGVFSFDRTDTIPKDDGFFANDKNIIYSYKGNILNNNEEIDNLKYTLEIDIPGLEKVSSETSLASDAKILAPLGYNNPMVKNEIKLFLYGDKYVDPQYQFKTGKNSRLYEIFLEIFYYEKVNGEYKLKVLKSSQGTKTANTTDGGQEFNFTLYGKTFYQYIHGKLKNIESSERYIYKVRYRILSAGDDLTMYIDLTKPTYGIVQEKPAFTNIVNGWGLFSSRTSTLSPPKRLDRSSLSQLSSGKYTNTLYFANYDNTTTFYATHRDLDYDFIYIQP